MTDKEFWQQVYLAHISRGKEPHEAKRMADDSVVWADRFVGASPFPPFQPPIQIEVVA